MLPMEFDHRILNSLPVPTEEGTKRILRILHSIVAGPIMSYFRHNKGTDPIHYARVKENLTIQRNEDENNRIRNISLITRVEHNWTIKIHERIFDYLAFVIAVGMPVTRHPPHRSVHEELSHTAPTLGC